MPTKTEIIRPDARSNELFLQNAAVSICLLVNRRHGYLRVIDFRAGPTAAKRSYILAAARRVGVEKVFTLVERDDVATWARLGFTREGSIPGFYRRSDAAIMGIVVSTARPLHAPIELDEDDDAVLDEVPVSSAAVLSDKTLARAKRLLQNDATCLPPVKLVKLSDADARKAVAGAQKKGMALTAFEPFGRDVARSTYVSSGRTTSVHISAEAQPFFQSSFLEVLASPRSDAERLAVTAAIGALGERLRAEGTQSVFALGAASDVPLAAAFLANGFRRSASLVSHLVIDGERRDAIVWSKKLAQVD